MAPPGVRGDGIPPPDVFLPREPESDMRRLTFIKLSPFAWVVLASGVLAATLTTVQVTTSRRVAPEGAHLADHGAQPRATVGRAPSATVRHFGQLHILPKGAAPAANPASASGEGSTTGGDTVSSDALPEPPTQRPFRASEPAKRPPERATGDPAGRPGRSRPAPPSGGPSPSLVEPRMAVLGAAEPEPQPPQPEVPGAAAPAEEAAGGDPRPTEEDVLGSSQGVMARFYAPSGPPPPPAPSQPHLPEVPDREVVEQVLDTLHGLIQRCYDRSMVPGRVVLVLTVEGQSGQVLRAQVSEISSTAICIRRVARTLQFPRFRRDTIVIERPYIFK